jgi:hypothetical protein
MGMAQWMRVFDTVSNLAQLSGRFRRSAAGAEDTAPGPLAQLGHLETRLTGVVVAALKEAFDRDRARLDLERAHLDAERQRAEEALRAELRRQAADRALAHLRTVSVMAIGVWMLSAALAVWIPGMHGGAAKGLLGGAWLCVLISLAGAFSAWRGISDRASSSAPGAASGATLAESLAGWSLLGAVALGGAALLAAL